MFWLAASCWLSGAVALPPQGRLNVRDRSSWKRIQSSVISLVEGDRNLGPAALIDSTGFFVASAGAVVGNTVQARMGDARLVTMTVMRREKNTDLVLLRAEGYEGGGRPLTIPTSDNPSGALFAVLSTGPAPVDYVPKQMYAVLESTRRAVPIIELRFETPTGPFGTGLIISESGDIYGSLNGALSRRESGGDWASRALTSPTIRSPFQGQSIGPGVMSVAYAVGPQVVRHVLKGFLSTSRNVVFPSLGVLCVDTPGGGALIQVVKPNSAAANGGILQGDILLDIGGSAIRNQLDFARTMFQQEAGKSVTIKIRRGNLIQVRDITVGSAQE